jgi:hypothetical protein
MLVQIETPDPEVPGATFCSGVLWLEDDRIRIQGVQEPTDAVRALLPSQVRNPWTDEMIGPEAGEDWLRSLALELQGPDVFACWVEPGHDFQSYWVT